MMKKQNGLLIESRSNSVDSERYLTEQQGSQLPSKSPSLERGSMASMPNNDCLECVSLRIQLRDMVQR